MDLLFVAFAAAWLMRGVWDGKVADVRGDEKAVNARLERHHPKWDENRRKNFAHFAANRQGLGKVAYQLRHGWSESAADVGDGWRSAKRAHQDWLKDREHDGVTRRPTLREWWQAGWGRNLRNRLKPAPKSAPVTDIPPIADTAPGAVTDENKRPTPSAPFLPPTGPPPMNGEHVTTPATAMTGEAGSIGQYRAHLAAAKARANQRIAKADADLAAARQDIAEADAETTAHENANNNLITAGLSQQLAGGTAALMEAALTERKSAEGREAAAAERLEAARGALAAAEQAEADLDSGGHTTTEEAIKGATDQIGDTQFYKE